ncbi:hypothetical protein H0H81_006222, partial [Sphagnurus paluster]
MPAITIDTPGYCYLVLFRKEHRPRALQLLGHNPLARNVMYHQPFFHPQWRSHKISETSNGQFHVHKEGGFRSKEHGSRRQRWLVKGSFRVGMIDTNTILLFLGTVIALVMGQAGIAFWGNLSEGEKALHSGNIASFIDAVKKEIRKEPGIKVELPDDYEGDSAQILPWLRRMELYFLHKKLQDDVEMMTLALQKIKKGKGNRAQEWADMHIKSVLQYQVELRDWKMANGDQEPTTAQKAAFTHQPPFASWVAMSNELLRFFQTTETQSKAIEKLNSIRQGTRDFEDYWMEFKVAATASQFDNAAIVNAFKETVNPGLGRKLVETARLTISDPIQIWADRATEFERAKRDAD